jgi:Tat protein secretion system quality control protein TatD with DNase activity
LHSFSAPPETLKQYLSPPSPTTLCPSQLFFSFSTTINARPEKGHLGKIGDTIVAIPDECLLVESDLHTAGEEADRALGEALLFISNVKGWVVEKGVKQLGENWRRFVFGDESGEDVEA